MRRLASWVWDLTELAASAVMELDVPGFPTGTPSYAFELPKELTSYEPFPWDAPTAGSTGASSSSSSSGSCTATRCSTSCTQARCLHADARAFCGWYCILD